jgi:hypothetical protein
LRVSSYTHASLCPDLGSFVVFRFGFLRRLGAIWWDDTPLVLLLHGFPEFWWTCRRAACAIADQS